MSGAFTLPSIKEPREIKSTTHLPPPQVIRDESLILLPSFTHPIRPGVKRLIFYGLVIPLVLNDDYSGMHRHVAEQLAHREIMKTQFRMDRLHDHDLLIDLSQNVTLLSPGLYDWNRELGCDVMCEGNVIPIIKGAWYQGVIVKIEGDQTDPMVDVQLTGPILARGCTSSFDDPVYVGLPVKVFIYDFKQEPVISNDRVPDILSYFQFGTIM